MELSGQRHATMNEIGVNSLKLRHALFNLGLPLGDHLNVSTLDLEFHRFSFNLGFVHDLKQGQHLKDRHVVLDLAIIGQAGV